MPIKEYGTRTFIEDALALPPEQGKGIRFGTFERGDNARFGWRDITSEISVRGTGSTDPDWARIGSTGPFYAYKFAVNDVCWMAFHIPHDILPGSAIHFHAHWTSDGTNAAVVKWQWQYAYAKGFNQSVFDVDLAESPQTNAGTITAQEAASGVAYRHMVTESIAVTLPGLTEPDGIVYCAIKRITNGAVNNTDGIFLLTSDIHYQTTNVATINKAPDFYAE
jgi:hypothetical protein